MNLKFIIPFALLLSLTLANAEAAPKFSCDKEWQCTDWSVCKDRWETRACNLASVPMYAADKACPSLSNAPYAGMRCVSDETNVKIANNCKDGFKNQDEEAIDCGGVCKPCPAMGNPPGNASAQPKPATENDQPEINFFDEFVPRFVTYSAAILISAAGIFFVLRHRAKKNKFGPLNPAKLDKKTYESAAAYIKEARSKGMSEEYIKAYLLQTGWDAGVVEEILKKCSKEEK